MDQYTIEVALRGGSGGSCPDYLLRVSRTDGRFGAVSRSFATVDAVIESLRLVRFSETELSRVQDGMSTSAGWIVFGKVPLSDADFRGLELLSLQ